MWQVKGKYPDYTKYNNESSFFLNADQEFVHWTWKAPIHWKGIVDQKEVQL